jgi:hypothetical protein
MKHSESITNLAAALNKAQASMSGAKKSANNPFFKSKFANLEEVIHCIKEPFADNGLSFAQFPVSSDGFAGVETVIMHESGEYISNEFTLKCVKNDPQGYGSAITYARRYGLQAAVGVPAEDDDGEGAMKRKPKVPPMDKARAISLLTQAIDTPTLIEGWKEISKHPIAKNEDVLGLKETRKAEFTLTT